jgi:sugar phosphate isomerase/epimerase
MIPYPLFVSVSEVRPDLLVRLNEENMGVELSYFAYPWNLEKEEDLEESILYHKKLLAESPVPTTLHGAFYDLNFIARDSMLLKVAHVRIQQSIDIARKLEVKDIVFHTNYIHSTHPNYKVFWVEKQVKFWEQYVQILEKEGIFIYLENTQEENYTYILEIVKKIQSPHIQICYDTGHSHCFTQSKRPPLEWAKGYGEAMKYIHLHSNHGQLDEHIAFHKGSVDFSGFFEHVVEMPQLPKVVIEVKTKEDFEASLLALKHLYQALP